MSNALENIKLTMSEVYLSRIVYNIANGRNMNATVESQADIVKLGKIQDQIKECNLGRDVALSAESFLMNMGIRHYRKNLRFEISYRSDIRTLSIEHVGRYLDDGEHDNCGNFDVSYAQETTHYTKVSLGNLAGLRNLINGSIVLRDDLQKELKEWLCCPIRLPNGREVYTIRSKHFSIEFIDKQEGV